MYTVAKTHICYLSVCQTECKKVGKGHTEQLQYTHANTHTHTRTHTEDSILQTGQPFKQLSVTVTHGNPETSPLFLPPQETQILCPVKGEPNELAGRVPGSEKRL